jgi:hypothetical protein
MLALEPEAVSWLVADLEINDGTATSSFNAASVYMNVADVMDALVVWADATFFLLTFAWSWARDPATGGAIITLSATGGTFTLQATNADAQAGYGLAAGLKAAATSHAFDSAAAGTWAPLSGLMVSVDFRVAGDGDACANGAIRPGVPGLAHHRPAVSAVGSALDAGRWASMLANAHSPRRANAWQQHTSSWVQFALGEATRAAAGVQHYRFELAASGDVI